MKSGRTLEALMWAGIVAAPAAWTCQEVFGYGVTVAGCYATGRTWNVPIGLYTAVATSVAGALVLTGVTAAALTWRTVRDAGNDTAPPPGRIRLLAIFGMTAGPLMFAIIMMSGIGALVLNNCQQS